MITILALVASLALIGGVLSIAARLDRKRENSAKLEDPAQASIAQLNAKLFRRVAIVRLGLVVGGVVIAWFGSQIGSTLIIVVGLIVTILGVPKSRLSRGILKYIG